MKLESIVLHGKHIRLEPLEPAHAAGLVTAASNERVLYQWSPVPQSRDEAEKYIATALSWRDAGTALPYATVRNSDNTIIGSTRFWNIENWAWPQGHKFYGRNLPDACEIGYTWLTRSAIRTPANSEAKLLMLAHAFETWQVLRVCLHTDVRNERSRAAIERIGGKFEGVLRAHRIAADFIPRDSARFSILAEEWPDAKKRLIQLMDR